MKKLLLIDGNAILHRAYHAYPALTNSNGQLVNAVYGFFSMLLTVLQTQKPDYLVVCFDRPKPTHRQALFAGYHANRPKATEDFISQIILVHELLVKMKVAVFELDGYEGDDMVGTIATQATKNDEPRTKDIEVIILTGDRDMLQLVNERVRVLMPLIGITKTVVFNEAAVEEKYGVHPRQFVDYKALIGDPSDGYPGVTGIGPKSASKLLKEYQTFENLYEHVGDLPEKIGLKLATDAEQAALAKKLAKIITDAPIHFDVDAAHCSEFDLDALKIAFEEHGFHSLVNRFYKVEAPKKVEVKKKVVKEDEDTEQLELL